MTLLLRESSLPRRFLRPSRGSGRTCWPASSMTVRQVPEANIRAYAMRVSKKKSASRLTIEFIAKCREVTGSPCCLTYSYAA
jgi:hypothetical protein